MKKSIWIPLLVLVITIAIMVINEFFTLIIEGPLIPWAGGLVIFFSLGFLIYGFFASQSMSKLTKFSIFVGALILIFVLFNVFLTVVSKFSSEQEQMIMNETNKI
jgi:hypothetical protein